MCFKRSHLVVVLGINLMFCIINSIFELNELFDQIGLSTIRSVNYDAGARNSFMGLFWGNITAVIKHSANGYLDSLSTVTNMKLFNCLVSVSCPAKSICCSSIGFLSYCKFLSMILEL